MNTLESFSQSEKRHSDFYRQKIAEHTPPKTENDKRVIRMCQRCLKRDRSFLNNLDLLKMIETMRMEAELNVPSLTRRVSTSAAPLDLDEFKALLDESL